MRRLSLAGVLFLLALAPLCAEPLVLHYYDRPPLFQTGNDGAPAGLVIKPLRRALQLAQLPHRWQKTPSNRQLVMIEAESAKTRPFCLVGWFRTPARERVGRFSRPLYRDRAQLALLDARLPAPATLAALLGQADWVFLRRERFSYGHTMDGLIAAKRPRERSTSESILDMARMIGAGRAAYTFVSAEEGEHLQVEGVRTLALPDMPAGETRHLWCSRAVAPATLARLDAALAKQGK